MGDPVRRGADPRAAKTKVRAWHLRTHPEEKPLIGSFRRDVTFAELNRRMEAGENFYEICDCGESAQREYCFARLAEIYGRDYDYYYLLWLLPSREEITAAFQDADETIRRLGESGVKVDYCRKHMESLRKRLHAGGRK